MFHSANSSLVRDYANEKLVIEAWGKDSLRVRGTMRACLEDEELGLCFPEKAPKHPKSLSQSDGSASITNGRITARVDPRGQITFSNQKREVLLQEFMRVRLGNMEKGDGQIDEAAIAYFNSALTIYPREFKQRWRGSTEMVKERADCPRIGIGRGCNIQRAIIDKNARIGDNVVISPEGKDEEMDGEGFYIREGIVVIPKNSIIASGTRI